MKRRQHHHKHSAEVSSRMHITQLGMPERAKLGSCSTYTSTHDLSNLVAVTRPGRQSECEGVLTNEIDLERFSASVPGTT